MCSMPYDSTEIFEFAIAQFSCYALRSLYGQFPGYVSISGYHDVDFQKLHEKCNIFHIYGFVIRRTKKKLYRFESSNFSYKKMPFFYFGFSQKSRPNHPNRQYIFVEPQKGSNMTLKLKLTIT